MIFTLGAPNLYEAQNRVASWKHTPTSKDALKQMKTLVPRLKELGVERIICAELDRATGEWLERQLKVPLESWECLNRFNAGKSHGISLERWKALWKEMEAMWKAKPDVPVKGGDSRTSFERRIAASRQRLGGVGAKALVIAPKQVIEQILGGEGATPYRLYEAEVQSLSH